MKKYLLGFALLTSLHGWSQSNHLSEQTYAEIEQKVIDWRRHFHQNPELSNREFKTAEVIAKHLKSLGLEVETGVAKTGVVGILKGKHPGKVLALRADIDALPVEERNDLPFKSKVKTTFLDTPVGVMHACGHDTHTAILMGAAELLSKHRDQIYGTIKFIFQPAEEGPPPGEVGGALEMVKEGVLKNPDVDIIVGLHINSQTPVGMIRYKPGGTMAAAQRFVLKINGKQTHGSQPWAGVDPILIAAKVIDAYQTIISRESDLTNEAAVISVGKITAGVRFNIIPESCELIGTVRTLDFAMQKHINQRMKELAEGIAAAYGGTAELDIQNSTSITNNEPSLVNELLPTLERVAGKDQVVLSKATTGAEDFSYFQEQIPGFYFFLGGMTPGSTGSYPHHTPDFKIDESGLLLGVKAMTEISLDYLSK
ncbi:MAG TPA: amidohydrolase [Flavobacteriaceae bacterium]|jgi:amidohydrolase|nr:amidohydrolase [Flavobacteriaceae bacterium]